MFMYEKLTLFRLMVSGNAVYGVTYFIKDCELSNMNSDELRHR